MDNGESRKNYRTRQQESLENYFRLNPQACVTADELRREDRQGDDLPMS